MTEAVAGGRPGRAGAAALACAAVLAGCATSAPHRPKPPPSTVGVGDCADPATDGVVSGEPDLVRADRDLDGDGKDETVVADDRLCTSDGNCHWNVFAAPGGSCLRYVGTVSASAIERLGTRGEEGFHDLRGWWRLTGGGRMLMQEYAFRHGGYRIVGAMPCRTRQGGEIVCGDDASARTQSQ